jgi:hypothetical protein
MRSTFSVSLNQTDVPPNLATSQAPADESGSQIGLLASFSGLAQAKHIVTLTVHAGTQQEAETPLLIFDRAVVTASTNLAKCE